MRLHLSSNEAAQLQRNYSAITAKVINAHTAKGASKYTTLSRHRTCSKVRTAREAK